MARVTYEWFTAKRHMMCGCCGLSIFKGSCYVAMKSGRKLHRLYCEECANREGKG